jgi:hypothetical protein
MPSNQLPRTLQPPPELPNDPKTSDTLAQYLRTFSLWCRHGFADKISATTATNGLLIQAKDVHTGDAATGPHRVYLLEVTNASGTPAITLTLVAAGSGKP